MGFLKTCFCLVILAIVLQTVIHILMFIQPWASIHNHAPGPCRIVNGIENGSEDMESLRNGLTFITSGASAYDQLPGVKGKIYLYDLNKPGEAPLDLKIVESDSINLEEFVPHGISLREDQLGGLHVYVINHPISGGHYVEKFDFDIQSKSLIHIKTIADETFGFLNDVVVVGDDQFYATNMMYSGGRTSSKIEILIGFRWGRVLYYDGTKGRIMDDRLLLPNGIAQSKDKKLIYVAVSGDRQIRVYQRKGDNDLGLLKIIDVYSPIDNINICHQTGDLWVGSQPVMWQGLKRLADLNQPATSQVLRISLSPQSEVTSMVEVYADAGHRLYGASVALKYKEGLLVGTVNHKMMYCEIKYIGI